LLSSLDRSTYEAETVVDDEATAPDGEEDEDDDDDDDDDDEDEDEDDEDDGWSSGTPTLLLLEPLKVRPERRAAGSERERPSRGGGGGILRPEVFV